MAESDGFIHKVKQAVGPVMKRYFGTDIRKGDFQAFDQRGAILIRGNEKSIADASSSSMAIPRPNAGNRIDSGKAMDSYFSWPYACIKVIADEMANVEFRVYQVNGEGEHEEVMEHEVIDFIEGVNDFQTGAEFKHMMAAHLELTGNAYILLMGVKNFDDKPKAMHLLDPAKVKIELDKSAYPFKISHYEFTIDSRKYVYQPYEIIQIKYPDPSNPYQGIGTVQALAEWIDNDNYVTEFVRMFFKNGARIDGLFKTEYTTEEQLHALKVSFMEQYAGVSNAHKTMAMPKGVEFVANSQNLSDIGLDALQDTVRDKILAGFRVSKTILGTAESDTNRATAETADYVFAKRTIKPKMQLIMAYLNNFLVPRFGEDIYLGFVDPVPEDKQFKTKEMQASVGNAPVLTPNEAREQYLGKGPLEGGDVLFVPTTMATLENASKEKEDSADGKKPSGSPKPAAGDDGSDEGDDSSKGKKRAKGIANPKKFKTQFSRAKEHRQAASEDLASRIAVIVAKGLEAKKKGAFRDGMSRDEYEATVVPASKSRATDAAGKTIEALRSLNMRQQIEVQKALPDIIASSKGIRKKKLALSRIFDLESWITLTTDALTPILSTLYKEEASAAGLLVDAPDISVFENAENQAAFTDAVNLMSRSYNETARELLRDQLEKGISAGASLPQLSDMVSDIYEFQNQVRAEQVARTEMTRISSMANKAAWQAAGSVATVKWHTSEKDNVCGFCQEMDDTVIDINQNFLNLGDEFTGADGKTMTATYSDVIAPPLHVNCGCYIRPWDMRSLADMEGIKAVEPVVPEEPRKLDEELMAEKMVDNLIKALSDDNTKL